MQQTYVPGPTAEPHQLTVFYDGACPLCRREIGFYQRRDGAQSIDWVDVSRCAGETVAPGLTKAEAMARFHVKRADGRLASGGLAFAQLWAALPGFRPFGLVLQWPPLAWLTERVYRLFLKVRPRLQALAGADDVNCPAALPTWLLRELRSDHAGETGAVQIYRGILAISRDPEVRHFAEAHLATERQHLADIEAVLPPRERSSFLPLWRLAGFLTGALPALFGRNAVFATIGAVETFVDHHYAQQVARLTQEDSHPDLRDLLERCRLDEVQHRDEAQGSLDRAAGPLVTAWCWMVGRGSALAVALARRA